MASQDTTTAINPYGRLCTEVYDFDKPPGATPPMPDIPFYLQRLEGMAGPILEPAVGTGRMLIPLLEAGHDAEGFEPSEHMLARCREHCRARGFAPRLWNARFQDFESNRIYGAIIVSVQTFTFIDDFDEALAVLRRFHDHLRPGGLLMIDLPEPRTFWNIEGVRAWTLPNGDLIRLVQRQVDTDPLRQRAISHMVYERWREGRLVESELEVMAGRSWGLDEFRLALAAAGFSSVEVLGGYRRRPLRRGDKVMTFEALK